MYKSGLESMRTLRLKILHSNSFFYFFFHNFINIQFITSCFFKSTTIKRQLSVEFREAVFAFREKNQTYDEIVRQMKLVRSIVIIIIHRVNRQQNVFFVRLKRMNRFFKLSDREKQTFICHIDNNSQNSLIVFVISLKSNHQFFRNIVRKYMKFADFLRFRIKRKSYLIVRHKIVRLIWIRYHKYWIVKNWNEIVWTNEITYETELNTRFCYVSKRKNTAMKTKYLKFTFKNERNIINVWKFITFDTKNSMHVLTKKQKMNSDIYINEILKSIKLFFFKRCLISNKNMIWMNDEANYHISKKMIAWNWFHDFKCMNWSTQSFDFNLIENLWRIIKIRISVRRHQIHNIEIMKLIIKKKWKFLKMKNYVKFIENMSRRIQLIIKIKKKDHQILIISVYFWFSFWSNLKFSKHQIERWIKRWNFAMKDEGENEDGTCTVRKLPDPDCTYSTDARVKQKGIPKLASAPRTARVSLDTSVSKIDIRIPTAWEFMKFCRNHKMFMNLLFAKIFKSFSKILRCSF